MLGDLYTNISRNDCPVQKPIYGHYQVFKQKFTSKGNVSDTDIIVLKAFTGLLYSAGVYKSNRQSLEDLWDQKGDGIETFGSLMSIKRFKVLIRGLRFDDRTIRN